MIDLLLENTIVLFSSSFGESLNWIGRVIQWIIDLAGNVGVGIILFTLALKLITLPLDIYSKASMRKNSLKMEKMRPQLEKLQKQYQNDQQVYNQKMMELYKKNGYSMFGACLPMIVTLVLFIIVLGAFDDYSNYMNVEVYRQMAQQYNAAITQYAPELTDAEGNVTGEVRYIVNESQTDAANGKFAYDRVIEYAAEENADTGLLAVRIIRTEVSDTQLDANNTEQMAALFENIEYSDGTVTYYIQTDKVLASNDEFIAAIRESFAEREFESDDARASEIIRQLGRNAAEAQYRKEHFNFLWVKNIWYPDTSYEHPVKRPTELNTLQTVYDELTYNLGDEKSAANGYYVLIVISIGTMFLSQFIMARSQKAQNELQTADGRGQKTQKVMMIVMPIVFGIFSFFYSSAFSIYMITSNVFGILSTLIINFFIDRKFRKIEEQEIQEKYNKRIPQSARKITDTRNGGKKK